MHPSAFVWVNAKGALDLVSIPWATFVVVPAAALLIVGALGTVVGYRTAQLDPARTLRGE